MTNLSRRSVRVMSLGATFMLAILVISMRTLPAETVNNPIDQAKWSLRFQDPQLMPRDIIQTTITEYGGVLYATASQESDPKGPRPMWFESKIFAVQSKTGDLLWTAGPWDVPIEARTCVSGDDVYAVGYPNISLTIRSKDGRLSKRKAIKCDKAYYYPIVADKDRLYIRGVNDVGLGEERAIILVLSRSDSKVLWRRTMPDLSDLNIFALDSLNSRLYLGEKSGALTVVNARTGKAINMISGLPRNPRTILFHENYVYWIHQEGVVCLDAVLLRTIWRRDLPLTTRGLVRPYASISPRQVYPARIYGHRLFTLVTDPPCIYVIDLKDGRVVNKTSIPELVDPAIFAVMDNWVIYGVRKIMNDEPEDNVQIIWLSRDELKKEKQTFLAIPYRSGSHALATTGQSLFVASKSAITAFGDAP